MCDTRQQPQLSRGEQSGEISLFPFYTISAGLWHQLQPPPGHAQKRGKISLPRMRGARGPRRSARGFFTLVLKTLVRACTVSNQHF